MKKNVLEAKLITAIKTPYLENGSIDYSAYDKLVERQIQGGTEGLVVTGTTGEGHLLKWEEQLNLIAYTAKNFGSKIIVIGNTGSNSTREACYGTQKAFEVGMDISLQINPYYGKTSESGIVEHFKLVLNMGPGIIYNVPSRTAQDITPNLMYKIAENENFVGVKECTKIERIQNYESNGVACWSGNDEDCFAAKHTANSHGVISVVSNIIPSTMHYLMNNNDQKINDDLADLIEIIFCEPNPIPLNTVLAMMKLCKPVLRMPYFPLSLEQQRKVIQILKELDNEKLETCTLDRSGKI